MRHPNIRHNTTKHINSSNQIYYWIVGTSNSTGRGMIYGCKKSREEAEQVIGMIKNAVCEIVESRYSDESKFSESMFTREQRARDLMEKGDIDEASRRYNHTNRV